MMMSDIYPALIPTNGIFIIIIITIVIWNCNNVKREKKSDKDNKDNNNNDNTKQQKNKTDSNLSCGVWSSSNTDYWYFYGIRNSFGNYRRYTFDNYESNYNKKKSV